MKPVAWIDPKELNMDVSTTVTKNKQFDGDIPLYTAPRELSDEEIIEIADGYWLEENYQIIDFVRQIEKAKTRILANPEVEQSHLTSNEIISQPVAYMETDSLLKWLIPVYPSKGTQLYPSPRELSDELPSPVLQEYFEKGYMCAMESLQLSDEEIRTVIDEHWEKRNVNLFDFARAILKKASEK